MILRRLGNKSKIADKIIGFFPSHKLYIEPFFGAGGVFFNKPLAQYNIVNDIDSDVFNLFQVVKNRKQELQSEFTKTPIHSDLLEYWKNNKENDPIFRAIRFLHLSNLTLMGKGYTLKLTAYNNAKELIDNHIDLTFEKLKNVQFVNYDFRKFIRSISFGAERPMEKENAFFYCDPPYLNTTDNYSHSFKNQDFIDLLNSLDQTGCKYAISEFDNDFVLEEVKHRKLNYAIIGDRQNLKNRRTEILITNYKSNQLEFNFNYE